MGDDRFTATFDVGWRFRVLVLACAMLASGCLSNSPSASTPNASVAATAEPRTSSTGMVVDDDQPPVATHLADGRVLLVHSNVRAAEVWDPATGVFTRIGDPAIARATPILLALPDGSALLGGPVGAFGDDRPWTTTEILDPSSDTFRAGPTLQVPRGLCACSGMWPMPTPLLLRDGRIAVVGVESPQSIEFLDLRRGTSELARVDVGCGSWAGVNAALLTDGRIFLRCLGHYNKLSGALVFDPVEGRSTPADRPTTLSARAVSVLVDGRVLLSGTVTGSRDPAEIFDPSSGAFERLEASENPESRTALHLGDGRILFPTEDAGPALLFDPSGDTFGEVHFPNSRVWRNLILADGRILRLGIHGRTTVADPAALTLS